MKKYIYCLFVLIAATGVLLTSGWVQEAKAGPHVSIRIPLPPPPPPFLFPRPPEIIVVPRSEVVIAPHPEVDVFFYGDYWWSPRGNRWFRSRNYNGPWNVVRSRYVPSQVRGVPRDYRTVYEREPRYPYEDHDRWRNQRTQERRERRGWREQRRENRDDGRRGRNNN